MTVKTAPHGHGMITAGMPNVFIENTALTRSQHGTVRFTLIRNLLTKTQAKTTDLSGKILEVTSSISSLVKIQKICHSYPGCIASYGIYQWHISE